MTDSTRGIIVITGDELGLRMLVGELRRYNEECPFEERIPHVVETKIEAVLIDREEFPEPVRSMFKTAEERGAVFKVGRR